MICRQCKDIHAGNDLSLKDGGISLALGDCPRGGTRHEWRAVNFVADVPYIVSDGDYKARKVTLAQAQAYVREAFVMSVLRSVFISKMLSAVLDAPIIHRKNPQLRMDIGDRMLAPILPHAIPEGTDVYSLVYGKDYELLVIERTA